MNQYCMQIQLDKNLLSHIHCIAFRADKWKGKCEVLKHIIPKVWMNILKVVRVEVVGKALTEVAQTFINMPNLETWERLKDASAGTKAFTKYSKIYFFHISDQF